MHFWPRDALCINEHLHASPTGRRLYHIANLMAWFNSALDGEIVALDEAGKPSFNTLQNYGSSKADLIYYIFYYIFDVMVLAGKDVMAEPLVKWRDLLEKKVLPNLAVPIRYSPALAFSGQAATVDLLEDARVQGHQFDLLVPPTELLFESRRMINGTAAIHAVGACQANCG